MKESPCRKRKVEKTDMFGLSGSPKVSLVFNTATVQF